MPPGPVAIVAGARYWMALKYFAKSLLLLAVLVEESPGEIKYANPGKRSRQVSLLRGPR